MAKELHRILACPAGARLGSFWLGLNGAHSVCVCVNCCGCLVEMPILTHTHNIYINSMHVKLQNILCLHRGKEESKRKGDCEKIEASVV